MNRIIIILFLLAYLALGYIFYAQNTQLQTQKMQYEELKDDYRHLLRRLNGKDQPELLRAHKKPKK